MTPLNFPAGLTGAELYDRLCRAIDDGSLPEGTRLPAERALAQSCALSRGTIRKVYCRLEQSGRVQARVGCGSFVHRSAQPDPQALLDTFWFYCRLLHLSDKEIEARIRAEVWGRLDASEKPRVVWLECNPELLASIGRTISNYCDIPIGTCLISDALAQPQCVRQAYDIAIVPFGHRAEIEIVLAGMPVVPIAMHLNNYILHTLGTLGEQRRVAVLHSSVRYLQLIRRIFDSYPRLPQYDAFVYPDDMPKLDAALAQYDGVLYPEAFSQDRAIVQMQERCLSGNIAWIPFDFFLDVGSLLHLNDAIFQFWSERALCASQAQAMPPEKAPTAELHPYYSGI